MLLRDLATAGAAAQTILYVDDDAPAGGDGLSWDTAYRFLQDALFFASDPGNGVTEIRVGQGTYAPDSDNRWTIPVGGGFGKVTKWGEQPVDLSMQGFYNVESPKPLIAQGPNLDNQGETWTLRLQLKLLFPK